MALIAGRAFSKKRRKVAALQQIMHNVRDRTGDYAF